MEQVRWSCSSPRWVALNFWALVVFVYYGNILLTHSLVPRNIWMAILYFETMNCIRDIVLIHLIFLFSVDEGEEDDGDEVYNRTTTVINQAVAGPSRNQSSEQLLYGIDNQGLDTDFNSVFENIQIKQPPQASLI